MGGRFTLSDDSHGVAQVGLNFERVLDYLKSLGVTELYYLERQEQDLRTQSKLTLVVRDWVGLIFLPRFLPEPLAR
jgi:hypothetical protein